MIYGSVCSGIEAATQAWHPIGWEPSFFSEIDEFPRAVLQHHYPDVPCHGDFTTIEEDSYEPIDLLVGGTPCQSFSIAGLRGGLSDDRGNLALEYLRLADRLSPRWIVWENVPGVLSSGGGRDFGSFLGALAELGYGFAYRVLDAQYFGVAQRRRRVFVVGYLGDWRRAAAVLFERESLSGHPAPSREAKQEVAKCLTSRVGSAYDAQTEQFVTEQNKVNSITASYGMGGVDWETKPLVFGAQNSASQSLSASTEVSPTLDKSKTPAVSIQAQALKEKQPKSQGFGIDESGTSYTLTAGDRHAMQYEHQVRRLTPIECERLQGFPDDYTRIPYRNKAADVCPDSPRYKAMGNSMAVPVMRWIGERIQMVEDMT